MIKFQLPHTRNLISYGQTLKEIRMGCIGQRALLCLTLATHKCIHTHTPPAVAIMDQDYTLPQLTDSRTVLGTHCIDWLRKT